MKKLMIKAAVMTMAVLPLAAFADTVTFEISDSWSGSGFSASTLHAATGCSIDSDLSVAGITINRCGAHGAADDISGGSLTGDLTDGIFSSITGYLVIGGVEVAVTGGSFGGAFYDAGPDSLADFNWFLDVDGYGTFYFEDMLMGSTGPNRFDGETLVLWGQNTVAYFGCMDEGQNCTSWGIDLHGVLVPEPTTIAIFGLGLLVIGMRRRNRHKALLAR